MESHHELEELYRRYVANDLTEEELDRFLKALHDPDSEQYVSALMDHTWKEMYEVETAPAGKLISIRKNRFIKYMAAASIVAVIGIGLFFLLTDRTPANEMAQKQEETPVQRDIAPGGDKAVLTLADGRRIILDSAGKGTLAQQGGTKVINLDGQLAYQPSGQTREVLYNTISTPKGGQYKLKLADGSTVWLNAASSLRFPAAFTGKERMVELTGEGYFEVAPNFTAGVDGSRQKQSFVVRVNTASGPMDVRVLGTHFNINSYSDEPFVKTTLLEGRVMVLPPQAQGHKNKHVYLNPGQQAILQPVLGNISVKYDVDVDGVVAWKNGLFVFDGAGIETIMRQIQRWYDVEVEYDSAISKETFSGIVNRGSNVSAVLKVMGEGGVQFRIEGKKIIVY